MNRTYPLDGIDDFIPDSALQKTAKKSSITKKANLDQFDRDFEDGMMAQEDNDGTAFEFPEGTDIYELEARVDQWVAQYPGYEDHEVMESMGVPTVIFYKNR